MLSGGERAGLHWTQQIRAAPSLMYKQDELISCTAAEGDNCSFSLSCVASKVFLKIYRAMDVGERSIVDMIAKVIEEGTLLNLKHSGLLLHLV